MSRWQFLQHRSATLILISQLACVLALVLLGVQLERPHHTLLGVWLALGVALVAAITTMYEARALLRERRSTAELAHSVLEQRKLSTTLEQAVASRTLDLEDAQRVLQRMWQLGQQITRELDPQRVLDRFLEAVSDIALADGGFVALVADDARIRIVAGVGLGQSLTGRQLSMSGSMFGTVIRTGKAWTTSNIQRHEGELDPTSYAQVLSLFRSVVMIPISRYGERIGVVVIGTREEKTFSRLEIDRIESTGDLLSVSLENAELVQTLRQSEWRFRTLFRVAPDAVLTVLQSGRIREANDAIREITGWDSSHVVGREVAELVVELDRPRLSLALQATFTGQPQRLEVTCRRDPDAPRHVVALAMTRLPEAEPPSVLIVGRDMTGERDMRVRLMEADRLAAVGELVAGVAHEVNNPLSSISAFAQLLLRDNDLTPAQRDSLEIIKSETIRASQVVKDLLAFARRSEPQREPIDLNAILARTLRLRGYQLTSNKVTVECAFASDLPSVIGDARQLQQVCLNLVTNAIQAMMSLGGGRLSITTRSAGRDVVLEVRDTGCGIPDGVRARVFEPFFTTKREGEGTGLGLSVSYGIVHAHGGSIEVSETSKSGTTFRVVLPAEDATVSESRSGAVVPHGVRSLLAGLHILFVDDEPSLRSGAQAFGAIRGFTVVVASDGAEALELIRTAQIDAIVCDMRMPGMDGAAFHERLFEERPDLAARTVFVTGDASTTARSRSVALRQPVMTKPFSFERLEAALVAVMRGTPFPAPLPAAMSMVQ